MQNYPFFLLSPTECVSVFLSIDFTSCHSPPLHMTMNGMYTYYVYASRKHFLRLVELWLLTQQTPTLPTALEILPYPFDLYHSPVYSHQAIWGYLFLLERQSDPHTGLWLSLLSHPPQVMPKAKIELGNSKCVQLVGNFKYSHHQFNTAYWIGS